MELVGPKQRPWKQALPACLAAAGLRRRLGLGQPRKAQIWPENRESNYSLCPEIGPILDTLRA